MKNNSPPLSLVEFWWAIKLHSSRTAHHLKKMLNAMFTLARQTLDSSRNRPGNVLAFFEIEYTLNPIQP